MRKSGMPTTFKGGPYNFIPGSKPIVTVSPHSYFQASAGDKLWINLLEGPPPQFDVAASDFLITIYKTAANKNVEYSASRTNSFSTYYSNPADAKVTYYCADIGEKDFWISVRQTDLSGEVILQCKVEVQDNDGWCL